MSNENYSQVYSIIKVEVTQDDAEVRECYLKHFGSEIEEFIKRMSNAFLNWKSLDDNLQGDRQKALVSALVYNAITLHIMSMKLFLSGYIVAAGNLQRQVIETIALGLLCSSNSLDVLDRYMDQKYSSNKAFNEVLRHSDKLNLKKEAFKVLKRNYEFYHKYSHPTLLTIAAHVSYETEGGLYVGAQHDEGKSDQYKQEINGRVGLSVIFSNFVDGIKMNLAKW